MELRRAKRSRPAPATLSRDGHPNTGAGLRAWEPGPHRVDLARRGQLTTGTPSPRELRLDVPCSHAPATRPQVTQGEPEHVRDGSLPVRRRRLVLGVNQRRPTPVRQHGRGPTLAQTGSAVTAANLSWNGNLAAKATTQFGFTASQSGTNGVPATLSCARS
jgi:hypothetical protein